jgi:hypothetical protein
MSIDNIIAVCTGVISSGFITAGSICLFQKNDKQHSKKNIIGAGLVTIGTLSAIGGTLRYLTYKINKINNINSFQHNTNVKINKDTYAYVLEYKRQLLKNITQLLNDLEIQFVISHGNLIEYERDKKIYHDDDLDIRFFVDDIDKWSTYCTNINNINNSMYNLEFDNRFTNINQQKINGIQANLIQFDNIKNIKTFPDMDIHCDLVANNINDFPWIFYDIDYNNLREITYLDINTYAPSKEDTIRILKKEYGNSYMTPNKTYTFNVNDI